MKPPRIPPRAVQIEHLPPDRQETAIARQRARLADAPCPPTYATAERARVLGCGCPPDDARYDAAECRHAPAEPHTHECVVWCATCSPAGPETVPRSWRTTPRAQRVQRARDLLDSPHVGASACRRALRDLLDEVATLTTERDDARRRLRGGR